MATLTLDEQVRKFARENGISGYENCQFGMSSSSLVYPEAVRFAERNGGRLQSLKDAIVYLVATEGDDYSNAQQLTSDMALYFRQGSGFKVAFVDGYDFVDRRNCSLISRYDLYCEPPLPRRKRGFRSWYLPMGEFCPYGAGDGVNVWRDEIAESGRLGGVRVFDVPENHLKLSTDRPSDKELENGAVYLGNHPIFTNLLTPRVAEVYSDLISEHFTGKGSFGFPLSELNAIPDGSFLCRSIHRFSRNFVDSMTTENNFRGISGSARGVVKPIMEASK